MRLRTLVGSLVPAVLLSAMGTVGSAQILYRPTPPPAVTAAEADWQLQGEPLLHAGAVYYPSGPTAFFDGLLMARVGEYRGVPLYADTTDEPNSLVYVPLANGMMKPYVRPRTGDLAGTSGSRSADPAIPVNVRTIEPSLAAPPPLPPPLPIPAPAAAGPAAALGLPPPPSPSTPEPTATGGIWVEFEGRRWFSAGSAVPYSSDRFAPIGVYHGFPVYRDRSEFTNKIYVPAFLGGYVAPYEAR
jgi:hypothetical protein